jgi:hypothetical protein
MKTEAPPKPTTDQYKITLREVILSYPSLFKATAMKEDQEKKFSATFILDKKKHKDQIVALEALRAKVHKTELKGAALVGQLIRDGGEREGKEGFGDGVVFLRASSSKRPTVIKRDKTPAVEEDDLFYGGAIVNAIITLWPQNRRDGKRVNASLGGVQFVREGERFGTAPTSAEEFPDVEDEGDAD